MIYHCLENVRIYQDREPECVEISVDVSFRTLLAFILWWFNIGPTFH